MTEMPVLVIVPNETSVVTTASGESFLVEIDESGVVRLRLAILAISACLGV